ncbi:hypothetical protein BC938DRAFT_484221 [Jimgerdemannia flammicorona]|uniref:Ubiquitin-like domain-containing protein n=1 Tax=Jimgerdemannia flammicorona TaxID=994334 RepID=A0A433QA68_9FUNG|nr:hypothetical protein BC938DRAFT_484221 [Jimgerdemannia flammicorona]
MTFGETVLTLGQIFSATHTGAISPFHTQLSMHHNHQIIINLFASLKPLCLHFDPVSSDHTVASLKRRLHDLTSIPPAAQRLTTLGGRTLADETPLFDPADQAGPVAFNLSLRLLGGSGGFGGERGWLAAQGLMELEMDERRIGTVDEARRLADILEQQPSPAKAMHEWLRRKIERGLWEPPLKRCRFDDRTNVSLEDVIEMAGSWDEQMYDEEEDKAIVDVGIDANEETDSGYPGVCNRVDKGKSRETKKRKERP